MTVAIAEERSGPRASVTVDRLVLQAQAARREVRGLLELGRSADAQARLKAVEDPIDEALKSGIDDQKLGELAEDLKEERAVLKKTSQSAQKQTFTQIARSSAARKSSKKSKTTMMRYISTRMDAADGRRLDLLIREDGEEPRHYTVEGQAILGRASEADITVACQAVSRRHCEFLAINRRFVVRDLGSSNGTKVNDLPVLLSGVELRDGDLVKVGDLEIRVSIADSAAPPTK